MCKGPKIGWLLASILIMFGSSSCMLHRIRNGKLLRATRELPLSAETHAFLQKTCTERIGATKAEHQNCLAAVAGATSFSSALISLRRRSDLEGIRRTAFNLAVERQNFWRAAISCSGADECDWNHLLSVYQEAGDHTGGTVALSEACTALTRGEFTAAELELRKAIYSLCSLALSDEGSLETYHANVTKAQLRISEATTNAAFDPERRAAAETVAPAPL